ncbi:MAG: DUF2299 domain-containing protein [Candidatus Aramenus sp.]|jgi:hypothetical protein|nr:DUF2299 domain-containing protein [Candidatus Aramenus sp.]
MNENDIANLFAELGMKVEKGNAPGVYTQLIISPPLGEGPRVTVIRPSSTSNYFVVTMVIEADEERLTPSKVRAITTELAKMNVEVYLTPPDKPRLIHIAKIIYAEGANKNDAVNAVTLVKNAGIVAFNLLAD